MSREVESGQSRDIETGQEIAMTWNYRNIKDKDDVGKREL